MFRYPGFGFAIVKCQDNLDNNNNNNNNNNFYNNFYRGSPTSHGSFKWVPHQSY